MTEPRAPRRDAQANRESILVAARTALAQDPNASVDLIARTAGLSRRALYGHFDDRSALIAELIRIGAQRFNAIAAQSLDDDTRIALAQLASRLWHEAAHIQTVTAIALDDAHVAETGTALGPLRRTVSELVERGRRTGTMRTDVPGDVLARLIEETARAVVRVDLIGPDAAATAVRAVLSIAGLSWREADALLAAHPEIVAAEVDA
ncbi:MULTISPECIES: TetR/AcrR family transcriptional regulator [Microbacterium]|uniref:TetR family transcriptional regulator n=1 Tax=Microbacterium profundi TaxID=450380 RepID=A0ABV3LGP5_9MICO|nr:MULTISPECIES: TetR/AcrR family transcriptional regulator [Microbacterium]MCE7481483.1 TetR/AcrR family transcriptional regulator [Microbacterium profundi]